MKNKIQSILAVIALLAATLLSAASLTTPSFGVAAPETSQVSAKDTTWGTKQQPRKAWGTAVTHAADDSGYARNIHIVCENGTHRYLGRGDSTFMGSGTGTGCSLSGVNRILVAWNQTVYCKNYAPPYENTYFYTGTNYVGSNKTYKCYDQWPL